MISQVEAESTPTEHTKTFMVQVLVAIEVTASKRSVAKAAALREVARRCTAGEKLHVRVEELKP
jgi:hypothetical protein